MKKLTPQEEIALIRGKLNHLDMAWRPSVFLKTGSIKLNSVLGDPQLGIPGGCMLELYGHESQGKSALSYFLASRAQKKGWRIIWYAAEKSWGEKWGNTWGLYSDPNVLRPEGVDLIALFQPYTGYFGDNAVRVSKILKIKDLKKQKALLKKIEPEISSSEMLCDEIKRLIVRWHNEDPDRPIFFVLDSITGMLTQYESEVNLQDMNMKTNLALASFMSRLLRRWVGLFQTHNVIGVFINQIRTKPGVSFGNPEYTPGGGAAKFFCDIRAGVRRTGGGKIIQSQKQLGIKGILKNYKNKAGGLEGEQCGYKIFFDGHAEFVDVAEVKAKGDE